MSVISLEKLNKLKKYELTEKDKKLIEKIRKSNELVSVCSGCTFFQQIKLKDMFIDEMLTMTNNRLDYNFRTE